MSPIIEGIISYIKAHEFLMPSLAGGLVDYLTTIGQDNRVYTITGILVHLLSAGFFGWMVGELVLVASPESGAYSVACGIGGLMGTRIGEIIMFVVKHKAGALIGRPGDGQ